MSCAMFAKITNLYFATIGYELIAAPREGLIMSDPKDSPILNAAIIAEVDVILSGDKHFLSLEMDHPKVLSPTDYFALMMNLE